MEGFSQKHSVYATLLKEDISDDLLGFVNEIREDKLILNKYHNIVINLLDDMDLIKSRLCNK